LPSILTDSQRDPELARNIPDTDSDMKSNFTSAWMRSD